ncbi:hypothetical protein [Methanoplanus limicola]|uniref:Uncharacterized protein n=1 Tax=Methanoplanus limicola DSM 2279 TaxID=937775 RepID=H1Z3H7_9EURY|nr:hypothetical protein [Methanoplanus limicola]EHQ34772.1 hypothetical protein Metlim_0649 [Methanoplanus limicola DSM 2279]
MPELFCAMFKEEWRMHSTLFGSLNFALFPFMIFAIAFMGAFLIPLVREVIEINTLALIIHAQFALLGIMVGSFGLLGKEVMNRRFGQSSLIAYSARSLPISEKVIFLNFIIKDIVYYFILWVIPFGLGFLIAAPFLGINLYYPLLLLLTITLSFLTGLCLVFLLSSVYSRSKKALLLLIAVIVVAARLITFGTGTEFSFLFPPLALFYSLSPVNLAVSVLLIILLFTISMIFFTPEYRSSEKHYKNRFLPLSEKLSILRENNLVAKDFIDLYRSGAGIGQTLFSFLLPLGIIWLLLSLMEGIIPQESLLFSLAVVTGVISSTMYTWLTEFDSFAAYIFLPVRTSDIIKAKAESFTVLQVIPVIFLVAAGISSGIPAHIPGAVVLCLSVSFFALSVQIRLCGLNPGILIYNVRVFLLYMLLIGPAVLVMLALTSAGPVFAYAGVILLIPAWHMINSGFKKWDNTEFKGL